MKLEDFNKLGKEKAREILFACCSSDQWTDELMKTFPYPSIAFLVREAANAWYHTNAEDWLQAFSHHPRIGNVKDLEEKFASTKQLASAEQSGIIEASQQIINSLAAGNKEYEEKYGFIFIVCATGKAASEMLQLLQERLKNTYVEELNVAMNEQHKITVIRLKKLLNESDWKMIGSSQLTTHVLNTSLGKPGDNISIRLQQYTGAWQTIAQGISNSDGRISDLLPAGKILKGNYKLVFETGLYFQNKKTEGFYPQVEIQFSVNTEEHYHVPLLINPFGYSTYRGS